MFMNMSGKQQNIDNVMPGAKEQRKYLTLSVRLDIIERYECGEGGVDSDSTLRTIHSSSDKIKASCEAVTPSSATKVNCACSTIMEYIERLLSAWMEHQKKFSLEFTCDLRESQKHP